MPNRMWPSATMPMATRGMLSPALSVPHAGSRRDEERRRHHREPEEKHPDASGANGLAGRVFPARAVSYDGASRHPQHHQYAPQRRDGPWIARHEVGGKRLDRVLGHDSQRRYHAPEDHYRARPGDVHRASGPVHRRVYGVPTLFGRQRPRLAARLVHRAPPVLLLPRSGFYSWNYKLVYITNHRNGTPGRAHAGLATPAFLLTPVGGASLQSPRPCGLGPPAPATSPPGASVLERTGPERTQRRPRRRADTRPRSNYPRSQVERAPRRRGGLARRSGRSRSCTSAPTQSSWPSPPPRA